MEPTPDIYQDLLVDRDEIRLLSLAPGQPNDPIHTSLSTASLNEAPQFEALSYVWGDPKVRLPIIVGGMETTVTENLEGALRRMRLPHHNRTLWVDAICINQTNTAERNSQVLLMSRIYRESVKVLVWLGPEDETVKSAIAVVAEIAKGAHFCRSSCRWDGDGFVCGNVTNLLNVIVRRPWWSRSWTLQEIALAKKVNMFVGLFQLDWESLLQAQASITKHRVKCCIVSMCAKCSANLRFFHNVLTGISLVQRSLTKSNGMGLIEVLARHRFRKATDPRDKVFGYLGLVPAGQATTIKPNYQASVEDVYCQAIVSDIKQTGSLGALIYASGSNHASNTGLPSWVTDWRTIPEDQLLLMYRHARYQLYNASNNLKCEAFVYGDKLLSLPGVLADQVHLVGDLLVSTRRADLSKTFRQWKSIIRLDEAPDQQYVTGVALADAFWRTLIVNAGLVPTAGGHAYIRAVEDDKEAFFRLWDTVSRSKDDLASSVDDPSFQRIFLAMPTATRNRRFFTTMRGFIGIGPPGMLHGDEVYILAGGRTPIILRKDARTATIPPDPTPQPLHTLVGDCYVHGMMDGEAVTADGGQMTRVLLT